MRSLVCTYHHCCNLLRQWMAATKKVHIAENVSWCELLTHADLVLWMTTTENNRESHAKATHCSCQAYSPQRLVTTWVCQLLNVLRSWKRTDGITLTKYPVFFIAAKPTIQDWTWDQIVLGLVLCKLAQQVLKGTSLHLIVKILVENEISLERA